MVFLTSLARLTTFLDASNVHSTPSPIFSPTLRTAFPILDDENVSGSIWMLKLSSDPFGQPVWLIILKSNGLTLYVLRLFRNWWDKKNKQFVHFLIESNSKPFEQTVMMLNIQYYREFVLCQYRFGPNLWFATGSLHFDDGQLVVFGMWKFQQMSRNRSWKWWNHFRRPRSMENWRAFLLATLALARSVDPCSCIHASMVSAQGQSAVIPAQWNIHQAPRRA